MPKIVNLVDMQFPISGSYSTFRIIQSTIESRCSGERRSDREREGRDRFFSTSLRCASILNMYLRVSYFVASLSDRYEDTVSELRAVTEEKAEKEKQLKKAKEHEDLLQIPVEDVKMTEIKLGGGGYGGNNNNNNKLNQIIIPSTLFRSESRLLAWMCCGRQDISRVPQQRLLSSSLSSRDRRLQSSSSPQRRLPMRRNDEERRSTPNH